jgi:hypothetical protein
LISFSRPIQWYHSYADPIWLGGTFKGNQLLDVRKNLIQVGSVDDYLATVLHMAVKYGVADTVRELIEHGADKDRSVTRPTGHDSRELTGHAVTELAGHDK